MLERWNDDKMDALDETAGRIDEQARQLRHEMVELRKEMASEFLRMHRLLIEVGFGIVLTLLTASHFL